jgi:hypothetical protein
MRNPGIKALLLQVVSLYFEVNYLFQHMYFLANKILYDLIQIKIYCQYFLAQIGKYILHN